MSWLLTGARDEALRLLLEPNNSCEKGNEKVEYMITITRLIE